MVHKLCSLCTDYLRCGYSFDVVNLHLRKRDDNCPHMVRFDDGRLNISKLVPFCAAIPPVVEPDFADVAENARNHFQTPINRRKRTLKNLESVASPNSW